ncbi:hypothetical protein [Paludibacterium purpuratum]|uniref:Uncharacterized protein n=1 Tax=Paludibacterium purpuratum TaxID=1144873 RepID=A0A4R7BES4_9NEIS|nr:hypothetical protein [Paludibacterium purpuratum]TDR82177.1 hypothetical protein DFP86_102291 [Paludibacterium purpuratum]
MAYVLIIWLHAGMMSHNDDVAITSIRFNTVQACETAAKAIESQAGSTVQKGHHICIKD